MPFIVWSNRNRREVEKMPSGKNCHNCAFYNTETGECHRYPPKYPVPSPGHWPVIPDSQESWCGEFKQG